jgi:hypothetical protein
VEVAVSFIAAVEERRLAVAIASASVDAEMECMLTLNESLIV